jgi:hypothetical protein
MTGRRCAEVERNAADLAAGDLVGAVAVELRRHAEACGRCRDVLAREARLQSALTALPAGSGPPAAPRLPGDTGLRLLRGRPIRRVAWAASAAAVVALATIGAWRLRHDPSDAGRDAAAVPLRVVDADGPFPSWDERLLALTAGAEAVAARRPAEGR